MRQEHGKQLWAVLLAIASAWVLIGCMATEEHDGVATVYPPVEMKCTCSPCGNPCDASPPPPPPSPPPPAPNSPSTSYCPPPPPPPPYFMPGPPGNLYPLDPGYYYIAGARRSLFGAGLPVFVACGFLVVWEYWWV